MSCSTLSFCDVEWSEEKTIESWMQKIRSRIRRRREEGEDSEEGSGFFDTRRMTVFVSQTVILLLMLIFFIPFLLLFSFSFSGDHNDDDDRRRSVFLSWLLRQTSNFCDPSYGSQSVFQLLFFLEMNQRDKTVKERGSEWKQKRNSSPAMIQITI